MALLWIEGFEGFGTTTGAAPSPVGVIARKYSIISYESDMDVEAGRLGGYCLELPYTGHSQYFRPAALTTHATMVIGFAVRFALIGNSTFLILYDDVTGGMTLRLSSAGEILVYRGGTLLGSTSGFGAQINTWYYMEFKVVCDNVSGSYELRVDEATVLSDSGLDTQAGSNAYHTTFQFQQLATNVPMMLDDIYCLDGSGSTNNDFLGNMRVSAIYPEADVTQEWTRSAGSDNYALVDEAEIDDDTTYVESDIPDEKDLYDYTALSGVTSMIKGIQVNTHCRETDAASFSLITVVKSSTTESDDSAQAIGTTDYVSKRRIVELDPHTSAPWTVSGINALQVGVKVG